MASALVCLLPATADAHAGTRCEDVEIRLPDGVIYTGTRLLAAYHTTCADARKVARYYLSHAEGNVETPRPYGYRCKPTSRGGVACRKGKRQVRWLYRRS